MQFRTLGMLEVWDDGRQLQLGQGRQRALLAFLVVHANEVVSTDRLIEGLWGDQAPSTASKVVQGYVSQLRRALPPEAILTQGSGYLLRVLDTDAAEFERLLSAARTEEPAEAATTLRAALDLWRGRPLADVEYDGWAQGEIGRLEELRLEAIEERIEAEVALGLHRDVVAELESLVAAHPLRERLRNLLMLALYRCDRQAEALEVYRSTRAALVDALGVEPSKVLQRLEQRILAQDPDLELPTADPSRRNGDNAARLATAPARRFLRPGWRRRDVSLIAAGALLLAAAVATGAYELTKSRAAVLAVPNSLVVVDPKTNRVTQYTAVGNTPKAVTVGAGSVWVLNANEQTLSRLDLGTGELQRNLPAVAQASDISFGRDAVWMTGFSNVLAMLNPDAPSTGRTLHLVRVGSPFPVAQPCCSVAATQRAVWATSFGAVWRIFPAPRRSFALSPNDCCGPIALGFGSVWLAGDLGLVRLDAVVGSRRLIPLPFHGSGVAVGAGSVWVIDALTDRVWRIDPNRNSVSGTTSVGKQPSGIAIGAGSVWISSADGTVSRIDPSTTRVTATVTVGGTPAGIAFGGGKIWVSVD
jgi:YVTN family beta-propeller protein